MRVALDPETFEYRIKPVPLVWFHDERFVAFLRHFIWKVPEKLGLLPSRAAAASSSWLLLQSNFGHHNDTCTMSFCDLV